jgi:hypothetical protein
LFVQYLWAFEIKPTAWRTVYGKPQIAPFKYQRTVYGKPHLSTLHTNNFGINKEGQER